MPELDRMSELRSKQSIRLADAKAGNESKESIARAQKLLDDIDSGLKLFGKLSLRRSTAAQ